MRDIERHISQYIESQFPAVFREEGPVLVQFVKAYYEWMESTGQPLFHARNLPSYRDIDTTLDEFVTYFKLKYLPNIQFTTASSRRLFVKNALDFHRSKGSQRSVELFFKLIYGVSANIYYPGDDLFKSSDGEWIAPVYVEISPSPVSRDMIGQLITGVTSFATAFVENYNRIRVNGKYIEVFYLSDVKGTFLAGELLRTGQQIPDDGPRVLGSVSSFSVISGGAEFSLGERVGTISENGQFATAIVTGVAEILGAANIELMDGGFGYNSTSEILISDKTLTVQGMSNGIFGELETVLETSASNSANVLASAQVIGVSADHEVQATVLSGDVSIGQRLTQGLISGTINRVDRLGNAVTVYVSNVNGYYTSGQPANTITGAINVSSYSALVGIANVVSSGGGTFTVGSGIKKSSGTLSGTISSVSETANSLSFSLGANTRFTNRITANVNLDFVRDYANVALDSLAFGFPKDPSGNVGDVMISMLRFEDRTYGSISNGAINSIYSGSGYTKQPFILIKQDIPYARRLTDQVLLVKDQTSEFIIGERVVTGTQNSGTVFLSTDPIEGFVTNAAADQFVVVSRRNLDRYFYEHDPDNYMIIGETSGATARITKVNVSVLSKYVGLNARIGAQVFTSNGLVTALSLETSGYGYVDGEQVTFFSLEDRTKTGLTTLRTRTHGVGAGYYGTRGGSLSSTKHLQDNDFYQEYSYSIETSIQPDTYKQMFDQVLHVAGTKGFSTYLSVQNMESGASVAESTLTVEE